MKKLVLLFAIILMTGFAFGQTMQKGNLVETHVLTVTLQPGKTMDHFTKFFKAKYVTTFEKNHPGWKIYLVKGVKGDTKDSFGLLYIIKSQKEKEKYYNADGSDSKLGKSTAEKMKQVEEDMLKVGSMKTTYTSWVLL